MIKDLLISKGPATKKEISRLEADLPSRLPRDYRNWVREYGGATVTGNLAMPDDSGKALLEELLTPYRAWAVYPDEGFAANVPLDFLIVGRGGGCGVCLRLSSEDFGSVWFADFDLAASMLDEGERSYDIMTKLADSWTDFLATR